MPLLTESGSLLCGIYQFTYRFIRQVEVDTNAGTYDQRYSRWVLPTQPVYIGSRIDNVSAGDGQIGRVSDNRIRLTIDATTDEQAYYTHFQVAVLRRLDGQYLPPTEAFILEAVPFTEVSSFPETFEVSSNYEILSIPISDITIDYAPIDSAKTIESRLNRLFLGNLSYYDRNPDSWTNWTYGAASVDNITKDIGRGYGSENNIGYNDPNMSHKYLGYFRDEVYRFGITYVDKYGNWSPVKVFDFSNGTSTNNSTTDSNSIDWRFPKRENSSYTLFNSSGGIDAIGLQIPSINYHPSWAVGFSIVRAKRRKNILYQTPLIPMVHVQPPKSYLSDNYDSFTNAYPSEDGVSIADYAGTLQPKSHYFPIARHIKQKSNDGGQCQYYKIETSDAENFVHCVFPQEQMYKNNGQSITEYNDNSAHILNIVDAVGLKTVVTNFGDSNFSHNHGEYRETNSSITAYANSKEQYYYERGQTKDELYSIANLEKINVRIVEYGYIENLDASGYTIRNTVEGLEAPTACDYASIQDTQATDKAPDVLRMGIIVTDEQIRDASYEAFDTADATRNVSASITFDDASGTPKAIDNAHISDMGRQQFFASNTDVFGVLLIANVTAELNDTRYGDEKEYHEFIPTQFERDGTGELSSLYLFSDAELTSVQSGSSVPITVNVWGGDCFISRHNFKITNSLFHLSEISDNDGTYDSANEIEATKRWGSEYVISGVGKGTSNNFDRPIALNGASQVIQLYLESTINADYIERETSLKAGANESLIEGGESEVRIPYDYNYMLSYSVENAVKIFKNENVLERDVDNFKARVAYSNQRVSETEIEGFDEFSALDFYDLEQRYGSITKLINFGNRLFCLQEDAFVYLPTQSRIIETDVTSDQLAVRSAEIIDLHQYISTNSGSQNIRSVILSDRDISYADVKRQKIIRYSDQMSVISETGLGTYFDEKFSSTFDENDLHAYYDIPRHEYIITREDNWSVLWSDKFESWITEFDISATASPKCFFYSKPNTYVVGIDSSSNLAIHKMYDSSVSNSVFMGNTVVPRVKFIINPGAGIPVVFDNLIINADQQLNTAQLTIPRDSTLGDYQTAAMDITLDPREHVYKIKILRNSQSVKEYTSLTSSDASDTSNRTNQRMRGTYGELEIKWPTSSVGVRTLTNVATKYRISYGAI